MHWRDRRVYMGMRTRRVVLEDWLLWRQSCLVYALDILAMGMLEQHIVWLEEDILVVKHCYLLEHG